MTTPKPTQSSSRPNLYLLGKPCSSELGYRKLPKNRAILLRYYGLVMGEFSNFPPKSVRNSAAEKVAEEITEVWKHHFGRRVIEGRDTESEEQTDEKKMIIRKILIKEKILTIQKKYHDTEYESRRIKTMKSFKEKENAMAELLDKPMNILKQGTWRTVTVEKGKKEKVWLPSGEEILARSGIICWEEDFAHLQNQLTVEQPGSCDSMDLAQQKKDSRKIQETMREEERKKKEEARKKEAFKSVTLEEASEEVTAETNTDDSDYEEESSSRTKRRKKTINVMGPMSAAADRSNVSCKTMALMAAAAAKGFGVSLESTNCSVTTAWRHRTKQRQQLAEEIKNSFCAPDASLLHWDGKSLKLTRGEKKHFIAIYLSGVKDGELSNLLGIPEAPGGTGKEEFEVLKATLESKDIQPRQVVGLMFDTTLSNTGQWEGVCSLLTKYFGLPILWFGCRHHILELRVKWFIVAETGQTKDPGRKLYRRFQAGFLEMETVLREEDLVRLDLSTRPVWLQELAVDLLVWAQNLYYRDIFPREDYAEFLAWVIWHLGGKVPAIWPLKMPGPDHQARWMADCIYNCKMLACRKVFILSEQEEREVESITEFVVLFYARPWFECSLAGQAAVSDLTFLCQIQRKYRMSKVWKVLEAFYHQLWYVTGELIPLALLSQGVDSRELMDLARALHEIQGTGELAKVGKPTFPTVTVNLTPHPTRPALVSFVTQDSMAIFDRLGLTGCNVSKIQSRK